jgi:nitrite reductase (cytochrome c-552)
MDALVALIADLKVAEDAKRSDKQVELARDLQRKAQFRIDFVEAENSMGFHAPRESERILGEAMNLARQAQVALRDPAFVPVLYPPARFSNAAPGQAGEKPQTGTESGAVGGPAEAGRR